MDQRLQEILSRVQQTASSAADAASDAAHSVGKKTSVLLCVGKMNVQLADLKNEVGAQLREVGEMVYATHTGDPTDSDVLLQKLQVIDGLNARISALSQEIARARGAAVCPRCGHIGEAGDVFCRSCGEKL